MNRRSTVVLLCSFALLLGTTGLIAAGGGQAGAGVGAQVPPVAEEEVPQALPPGTYAPDQEQTCLKECHDLKPANLVLRTPHGVKADRRTPAAAHQCETCHGPSPAHVAFTATPPTVVYKGPKASPAAERTRMCLSCHKSGQRMSWRGSQHLANDVACDNCHTVHADKDPVLVEASQPQKCFTCHAEVRADGNKMSHHPVREGLIGCASCHNVHGSTPGLLTKSTVNETCYTCHAEKRGPFVWEHAPARESCANCHSSHGSNQRNLLTSKDPFLCLSCHSYGGHINLPRYNRVSNPYGSGCSNCHVSMHGSNHPSGAKLTR
jgi:DmsE family decaheme c-type cytochrome